MRNDKRITNTAKFVITVTELMMFCMVWYIDYNDCAFRTHRELGGYVCAIVWLLIYMWLCALFGAFSIASSYIGDIVISQIICLGIPDLVLFIVCCLLARGWVSIITGIGCYICQIGIVGLGTVMTKRILMSHIIPDRTLVIYGEEYNKSNAEFFARRLLEKYRHLFEITEILDVHTELITKKIDASKQVILVGVSFDDKKKLAKYCIDHNKVFYYLPELEEIIFQNCQIKNLLDTPLQRFDFAHSRRMYQISKSIIDIILACLILVVASPFMLATAIAIKLEDGGPVLFTQLRVTQNERTFKILKFRSMVVDADKHGVIPTTGKDPRITKVGNIIRALRIDELPQLINILKGDMAFVGPRPERIEHVQKYEADLPEFKYRHLVKGGLTGYAQVYGKYNTSPEDKLKLDLIYIMNQSIYMDFRLFLLTLRTVFQKESTEGFSAEQVAEIKGGARY